MWKRLVAIWAVVRGDARMLVRAWRHPLSPGWLKPALLLLVVYLVSPIDLIPDTIPLLGIVDDLVLLPLAMRFILRRLPAAVRADIGHGPA